MKTTVLKISFVFLITYLMAAGCEKEREHDPLFYQGKVVALNKSDGCQNIIIITKGTKTGGLKEGNTISFNPDLYNGALKVGDIVYFDVIEYEEFDNSISTQPCAFPQFAAFVEFYNK